ncbi:hypothetical protein C8A05DRAFT_33457, partial [Staphylotrichum tortipilum]
MKPTVFLPYLLLDAARFAQALVTRKEPVPVKPPSGHGHYATYVFPEFDLELDWYSEGHTGPPSVIVINNTASSIQPRSLHVPFPSSRSSRSPVPLEERSLADDVCGYFSGCVQKAFNSEAVATMARGRIATWRWCEAFYHGNLDYFRRNNYEKIRDGVFLGLALGFATNIISTAFGNAYLNGQAGQAHYPTNDMCNKKDNLEAAALDFAAAGYQFCMAIKTYQGTLKAATHFTSGTVTGDERIIDGAVNLS